MNHHDLSAEATAAPEPGIWPLTVGPPSALVLSPTDPLHSPAPRHQDNASRQPC